MKDYTTLQLKFISMFNILPNPYSPTTEQVVNIAKELGSCRATGYNVLKLYRNNRPKPKKSKKSKQRSKKVRREAIALLNQKYTSRSNENKKIKLDANNLDLFDKSKTNPDSIEIWKLPDRDLLKLFIEFVGWRGHYDKEGYPVIDHEGEIHPGEAQPPPLDDITDEFLGITQYQADSIITYRDNSNILNIWGRRLGKTWKIAWTVEFVSKYEADKFLYFSLTDIKFMMANWVFTWADSQGYIMSSETVKVFNRRLGRAGSYQKFGMINGARFEIHGIRTSTTLGFHGWVIIFDDVIEISHKRLTHLQLSLIAKWNSQYSKIARKKLIMDNTRKFVGDFFHYMIQQFKDKAKKFEKKKGYISAKYVLTIDHKTPYAELSFYGGVVDYEKWIALVGKGKIKYDRDKIICPWYSADDIEMMRLENLKSFMAEMMGNPRSIESGHWLRSDLKFVSSFESFDYEAICMSVDPAWTTNATSDHSGVVIQGLKKKLRITKYVDVQGIERERGYRQYTVFKAFEVKLKVKRWKKKHRNGEIEFVDGLLEFLEAQYKWILSFFLGIRYILVIIETNSGGQVIVDIARSEGDNYEFATHIPNDEDNKAYGANSKLGKEDRIDTALFDGIKNQDIEFMDYLEDNVLIQQLLDFPDCLTDHAIDAEAKGKAALHSLKRVTAQKQRREALLADVEYKNQSRRMEKWDMQGIKGLRKKRARRSMLGAKVY